MYVQMSLRTEEDLRTPGAGVTGNCELGAGN